MASLACVPASPTSKETVCRIDVTSAPDNDDSAFDATKYPTEPAIEYYLTFEVGGDVVGKSYLFTPGPDGKHSFNNYVFPSAGSYTVRLSDASDDSSVQTLSVTVS